MLVVRKVLVQKGEREPKIDYTHTFYRPPWEGVVDRVFDDLGVELKGTFPPWLGIYLDLKEQFLKEHPGYESDRIPSEAQEQLLRQAIEINQSKSRL